MDDNFIGQAKIRDELHRKARVSNNENDWRIYRNQRNLVNNINKNNKSRYYNFQLNINKNNKNFDEKISNDKTMWKTVKNLTNNNKQVPPRVISFDGQLIASLKKICNIANDFYISKTI